MQRLLQDRQDSGSSLDGATRSFMENRLGADFSSVRVHTGSKAVQASKDLDAHAFTFGRDIYFNQGKYQPHSPAGKRLLAHELAHVAQQQASQEPPRIQRWAVSGCTPPQEGYIDDAVTRAYDDLSRVLPMISERPVPDPVKDALWLAFRDDSDATADLARGNIRSLKDQVTSTRFACTDASSDRGCRDGTWAYASGAGSTGHVGLCRPRFFADDVGPIAQAEAVVHEAAHLYLSMADRGYFSKPDNLCSESQRPPGIRDPAAQESGTAGDNPALRLENADSYSCFVHYLRYVPRQQRRTTAAGYRGENLRIEAEDLVFSIFTRVLTPQLHPFSIKGIPQNSGFRFRWKIRANGQDYNPTSMSSGVDAGAFNEANTAVYVSSSLAQLLWNSGIRQAKLICEVELFGPYGERFAPRIVTKEVDVAVENAEPPLNL